MEGAPPPNNVASQVDSSSPAKNVTTTDVRPVLQVRDLSVRFSTVTGPVDAVRGVSFDLRPGRTLGLLGESGSGKSVSSYSVLRLLPETAKYSGSITIFDGNKDVDVLSLGPKDPQLFAMRGGGAGMIFQEPMTALSPVHRTGEQVAEAVRLHRGLGRRAAWSEAVSMLGRVGIPDPETRAQQYPFEFSGGMRQRVVIAMALVCRPKVLIADEPTTALDVTVQAQILALIDDLKAETGAGVLFITHDLGVVAQVADDVAVMRGGRVVEIAPVDDLYRSPLHPYTRKLLRSVPGVPPFETSADEYARRLPEGRLVFREESGLEPELLDLGGGRSLLAASSINNGDKSIEPMSQGTGESTAQTELPASSPSDRLVLRVRGLSKSFYGKPRTRRKLREVSHQVQTNGIASLIKAPLETFNAVVGVDLDLHAGETLGVVGESGSGKTTLVRCLLRALDPTAGSCELFDDDGSRIDLASIPRSQLKPIRQRIQMVFQDPMASLNPRMTVGDIVAEPLLIHGLSNAEQRRQQAALMLDRVGLPRSAMSRYPHAFSGGQRQRVGIARAMILQPSLVVLDEATSALDVSVRGRVLTLLRNLQLEWGLTYIFVAHDLSLVRNFCDRVAVMRQGRIVEQGPVDQVLGQPEFAYTRDLIEAVPIPDPRVQLRRAELMKQAPR